MTHYETAPEDRISPLGNLAYGVGAFVNNLLGASISGMMIVLNLGLGMNPALVGLLGSLPRLTDALTDPLMGYISDNTRSRWGRRRPYIFVGAIAAGVVFALLWQLPPGKSEDWYFWYFLVGSFVFYLAYTTFATPWVALGYELTPDYHERTRLMGVQNFIGQLPYLLIAPWFIAIVSDSRFEDMRVGASTLAIGIGLLVIALGVVPAIFLRERFRSAGAGDAGDSESKGVGALAVDFFRGFALTLKFLPFLKLAAATFLVFNSFILMTTFQPYVIIYYVFDGDTAAGAKFVGLAATVQSLATFGVIVLSTWVSTRIGKVRTLCIALALSLIGYALKWFCYDPSQPWLTVLPAPLIAFSLGSLFTLMPSMIADVVDADELNTGERREGMFGSIFWWTVKLGQAAAIAAGGFMLNYTGFDVALGGEQSAEAITLMRLFDAFTPVGATALAIWLVASFPITEARAREVRDELEARRGKVAAPA